jgi:uncharacterized protein involved in type VI secretion and phage assembly
MATTNVLKDKRMVNALISIDGNELNYVSMDLHQTIGHHHQFRIRLDYDAIRNGFLTNPQDQIALIGKSVKIEIQQGDDNANCYEFRGIITNTVNEASEGKHGYLIIEGKSPTVLLERGKRFDLFSNMTLKDVFKEVLFGIDTQRLTSLSQPAYESRSPFLMQYNESDWEFLQRLSVISGETLYWTGMDLVFGEHRDFPAENVMYDKELITLRFGSRLLSNNFTSYQYLSNRNEIISQTPDRIENSDSYIDDVLKRSLATLGKERPVRTPIDLPVEELGSLTEQANRRKARTATETVYVTGIAKTCHPRIGRLMNIRVPDAENSVDIGTYRITKVVHRIDQNNRYECEFEGIPSVLKYRPVPEGIQMPVATSLLAEVTQNNDPQGQGRVQVKFMTVNDMRSEIWLRVMTPNAGGLVKSYNGAGNDPGIVEKNRGIVFIPEPGDQVMIGFEHGDPNRPYVMGSMFHGGNAAGGKENNAIKSIITASGHTIEFDDAEATQGITIKDRNGNVIHVDTKGKNIEITTPATMTLNSKNMKINVDESLDITVGKDLSSTIGGNQKTNILSGDAERTVTNLKETISANSEINIGEKLKQVAGETTLFAENGDMIIKSAGKALVQGTSDARISKG